MSERPEPFGSITTVDLWTDHHISEQMLRAHLDPELDRASRRPSEITAAVSWLAERVGIGPGSTVLDLGCGPGLYTTGFARRGASVTGVDVSTRSLQHARTTAAEASLGITYIEADYRDLVLDDEFDLVTMIMYDYGAMAPDARASVLALVADVLGPGGVFAMDVFSTALFEDQRESVVEEPNLMGGFWSPDPYSGRLETFVYADEAVTLERFMIEESGRTRVFHNWTQYFTVEALTDELAAAGLSVDTVVRDLTGRPHDPAAPEFAVLATL